MRFGHEEQDFGFTVGHWFEFGGRRVAVRMNKKSEPTNKSEIVEVLVEAMIDLRINEHLDGMPMIGQWRKFKRWRKHVAKKRRDAKSERIRTRDMKRLRDLADKYGIDLATAEDELG